MGVISNLQLKTRLLLGFVVVALLAGVVGLSGISYMRSMARNAESLYNGNLVPLKQINALTVAFQRMRGDMMYTILARTPAERVTFAGKGRDRNAEIRKILGEMRVLEMDDPTRKAFDAFAAAHVDFETAGMSVLDLAVAGKLREARNILFDNVDKVRGRMQEATVRMTQLNIDNGTQALEEDQRAEVQATIVLTSIVGVAVVLALLLGFIIARSLLRPIHELEVQADQVSEGDLTVTVTHSTNDEIGRLARTFGRMTESLHAAIADVSGATSAVASATTQISSSTEELAAGAHEQTSQTSEVASAVAEMTSTILENSKNATEAARTAKQAREAAQAGGRVVTETLEGMRRISAVVNRSAATVQELGKSSEQIGEIVSVINDIADQTNLLALNAAIEAARAGEQGRGFAVVADEVRKLAERTTKATKEIAGMIRKIQADTKGAVTSMEEGTEEVTKGITQADQAGRSLQEIVEISQRVTDMVSQIAAASEEQSSASEQISKNIEAISSVTEETASNTQQIAGAAEDLNRLTEKLAGIVGRFRLSDLRAPNMPVVSAPVADRPRVAASLLA